MPLWFQGFLLRHPWAFRVWFRYRCPYPIDDNNSARACFEAWLCGCDNATRFRSTVRQGERGT